MNRISPLSMVLIPLFLLLLPLGLSFDLPSHLAEIASPLANWCVGNLPKGRFQSLYGALCCGAALPKNSPEFQLFRHLGLVHLLVVSGLHLLTLEKTLYYVLQKRTWIARLSPLILVVFVAICQFAPPVTRAYLQRILALFNKSLPAHWTPSQGVFFTGLLTLCLIPSWFNSLSLQLSWTASLILCLRLPLLPLTAAIYLALIPYLLPLGVAHPLSLLLSGWAGALLLIPLLACAWVTFLIPGLQPITHPLISYLLDLLNQLRPLIPDPITSPMAMDKRWFWVYLAALHGGIYFWEIYRQRRLP